MNLYKKSIVIGITGSLLFNISCFAGHQYYQTSVNALGQTQVAMTPTAINNMLNQQPGTVISTLNPVNDDSSEEEFAENEEGENEE